MKKDSFSMIYPFAAIVGQESVKKALLLSIINPSIGGVLLSGEKGSAKSTLVRGLADLKEDLKIVDLPLNITEDRLVGTIDLEKTLKEGERYFEPGLLYEANGHLLYVDEVNLLNESIVNTLLSVAGLGENCVEREGMSKTHESRFVLVGTMNPEEGPLRSQFLDRFGLYVEVMGCQDLLDRGEIIRRRIAYDKDPRAFRKSYEEKTKLLKEKVQEARRILSTVRISEDAMKLASQIAQSANVLGHRGDIIMIETAKALAALDMRKSVNLQDIKEAAAWVLPHRKRESQGQAIQGEGQEELDSPAETDAQEDHQKEAQEDQRGAIEENPDQGEKDQTQQEDHTGTTEQSLGGEDTEKQGPSEEDTGLPPSGEGSFQEEIFDIGRLFRVKPLPFKIHDKRRRKGDGKRLQTKTDLKKGQYVRSHLPKAKLRDLAFDATLRAAAPFQRKRPKYGLSIAIEESDYREKIRQKRTGSTIVFVVDASASMGARKRMEAVKGAIVSLLTDAYQKRDKIALVVFRKEKAQVALDITRSVDLAYKCLKELPTGGQTPLSAGLEKGCELIRQRKKKEPDMVCVMVLVSDGRTNVALHGGDPFEEALMMAQEIKTMDILPVVVDTEQDFIQLKLAKELAEAMNAKYLKLEELEGDVLAENIREIIKGRQ